MHPRGLTISTSWHQLLQLVLHHCLPRLEQHLALLQADNVLLQTGKVLLQLGLTPDKLTHGRLENVQSLVLSVETLAHLPAEKRQAGILSLLERTQHLVEVINRRTKLHLGAGLGRGGALLLRHVGLLHAPGFWRTAIRGHPGAQVARTRSTTATKSRPVRPIRESRRSLPALPARTGVHPRAT